MKILANRRCWKEHKRMKIKNGITTTNITDFACRRFDGMILATLTAMDGILLKERVFGTIEAVMPKPMQEIANQNQILCQK